LRRRCRGAVLSRCYARGSGETLALVDGVGGGGGNLRRRRAAALGFGGLLLVVRRVRRTASEMTQNVHFVQNRIGGATAVCSLTKRIELLKPKQSFALQCAVETPRRGDGNRAAERESGRAGERGSGALGEQCTRRAVH